MEQQIFDLIWTFGTLGFILVGVYMTKNFIMEKFKSNKVVNNKSQKDKQLDDQITSLIDNAPKMIRHVEEEISRLEATGANEEQMKSLKSKKSMLSFVVENHQIIDMIGKPIIKKVLGMVKHLG